FDGLTADNLKNITVSPPRLITGSTYTITLKANEGYKLDGRSELTSNIFTVDSSVINYVISTRTNPVIIWTDILDNKFKELSTLSKVFNGVTSDNIRNMDVTIQTVILGSAYTITLKANDGYTINNNPTLTSQTFTLPIEDIIITKKTDSPQEIIVTEVTGDNLKRLSTLQKFFNLGDLTQNEIDEIFTASLDQVVGSDNYVITLSANAGFSINGEVELLSNEFTIEAQSLNIQKGTNIPKDLKPGDITKDKLKTLSLLSKVFIGPDLTQYNIDNNLEVELNTLVEGAVYSITLRAKPLYSINGLPELDSSEFTLELNIIVTAKTLEPSDITKEDIDNNNYKSFVTLQKLFNFDASITADIMDLAVTSSLIHMNETGETAVRMTVNPGFTINNQLSITSNYFSVPIDFNLGINPNPINMRPTEMQGENFKNFHVIFKLFNGIDLNQETLKNIDIEQIPLGGTTYKIKLIPKQGFTINTLSEGLTSAQFNVANINLTIRLVTNVPTNIRLDEVTNQELIQSRAFLSRLFDIGSLNQLDLDNYLNVSAERLPGRTDYRIRLAVKAPDIRIGGVSAIVSNDFPVSSILFITKEEV
ncbi:MAG: hypothetical protein ACRCXE_00585, partial [Metamycoplasmataceae bacterium]